MCGNIHITIIRKQRCFRNNKRRIFIHGKGIIHGNRRIIHWIYRDMCRCCRDCTMFISNSIYKTINAMETCIWSVTIHAAIIVHRESLYCDDIITCTKVRIRSVGVRTITIIYQRTCHRIHCNICYRQYRARIHIAIIRKQRCFRDNK